jgi:hypothetical protein
VTLGDGDDSLVATAAPVAVDVDGGDGDDRITGGPLADALGGGAGRDTFHVRDTATDTVDCGAGADDASDADPADADPHDTLTACEETPATAGVPDTFVVSGAPAATNETTADFVFSASEPAARFECSLDGAAFSACGAEHTFGGLAPGPHVLDVRAVDLIDNADPVPARHTWTVDRTPPQATFVARPAAVTGDATPAFEVAVSEPATLTCSLDGGTYVACSPTPSYFGLVDGAHDLRVLSRDAAGNETVIAAAWAQDTVRPQTHLTSGPATSAPVTTAQATLTFASPDGVRFECSLDGAAWTSCASPVTYRGLADGAHSFAVRAVDAAGNVDGTPAGRAWTVRADGAPTARIAVTRDGDGFVLDARASTDPEGGALIYRWQRNGEPAGGTPTIRHVAPDREARDVFVVTVTDRTGRQGRATVALRTRAAGQSAAHEAVEVIRFGSGTRPAAGARARIAALRALVRSASAIRIEGHARPSASASRLSRRRAQAVRALLVTGAAAGTKVTVLARGAARPVAGNRTAAGRARDDRVVVTVTYHALAERLVTEQEGNAAVRYTTAPEPVPAVAGRALKLFAFYSAVPGALRRLQEVGARVDVLAPNWYSLSPRTGAVRGGRPDAKVMALSRQLRFDVWPVVNAAMNGSALIDSAAGRAKIVDRIGALAARHRLAGVTLDMEEMAPRQKGAFSALVAALAAELHRSHRKLAVYSVRRTETQVTDSAAAYDWPALARAADLVLASGYNEHSANGTPGPVTTRGGFERVAQYAASVSRTKVAPTMGAFGWQWTGAGGRMISSATAERRWPVRAELGSADGRAVISGSTRTHFESAEDLWAREQAALRAGARWMGLFTLGREPERFWERSATR